MAVGELEETDRTPSAAASAAYVYGVVRAAAAPPVQASGIGGREVRAVPFQELAALSSVVPLPIRAKRRELLSHANVLNEAVAEATVVPMRFGAAFADADSIVRDFLRPRYAELCRLLEELDGHVELMVKAFYREDAILAEIVRDEPRVARLRGATRDRPAAATHAARIELGSAVASALEARTQADAAAILDTLRPFAVDVHRDETAIEHQVLRASVLVERRKVADVDAAMAALAERHAGRIQFKYVGPLAPHSFVSLTAGGSG